MKCLVLLACFLAVFHRILSEPCKGSATYKVAFQGEWKDDSVNSRPQGACFRGFLGFTHNHCYRMLKEGEEASTGVKNIAEEGDSRELYNEASKHLDKNILQVIESRVKTIGPEGNVIVPETNTTTDGFLVDGTHPYVSIIIGIKPSPDWFLGVQDMSLCNNYNGSWIPEKRVVLFPYDAGTDDGTEFNNSANEPSDPVQKISRLNRPYLYDGQRGMGYFVFTRLKTFPRMKDDKIVTECRASFIKWPTLLLILPVLALLF